MRSVPAGSFERLSSFPALWIAWLDYRRGKRRRAAVADFALDADLALLHLHQALRAGRFRPSGYRVTLVRDPKLRLIAAPAVGDRVLQRALLDAIAPTYERGYLRYMDDFVLFADRPETLHACRARIIDWLDAERGLRLKAADAPARDNRQPGVFLGFRISRGGIGPGPKALKRLRRRLRQGDDLDPAHLARSLAAFRGMWRALG